MDENDGWLIPDDPSAIARETQAEAEVQRLRAEVKNLIENLATAESTVDQLREEAAAKEIADKEAAAAKELVDKDIQKQLAEKAQAETPSCTLEQVQVGEVSTESPSQLGTEIPHHVLQEVRLLHSWFDRMGVCLLLMVSSCALWYSIPVSLRIPICIFIKLAGPTLVVTTSICAGFGAALYVGAVDSDGILLLLLNALVLIPYNTLLFVFYYPTWPLRMVLYQVMQFVMIPLMTFGKTIVSLHKASFLEWLRILPDAYNNILPADKPFDNCDDASQNDMANTLRRAGFVKWLHKESLAHIPKGMLNSLGFRLVFLMLACPTLGWWLVGKCYIPLLAVRSAKRDISQYTEDSSVSETKPLATPLPSAAFAMPECRMLKVVRKEFGEAVGRQKCLNE